MTFTDIIILVSILLMLSVIIYFNFIKNDANKCSLCNLKTKDSLVKKYYQKKTRGM